MKTIELNVYSFNELSKEAQEVAIKNHRNSDFFEVLNGFSEDVVERLGELNIEVAKHGLQYSLTYSQGDGLSFKGNFDVKDMVFAALPTLSEKRKNIVIELIYSLKSSGNNGRYCYASKNDVEMEFNYNDFRENKHSNLYELCSNVLTHTQNYYIELCSKFENQGYSQIEHERSDEAIKDTIIANDYEFLASGKKY